LIACQPQGKVVLAALFFTHLRYSPQLMWVVVGGGLFWLGILLTLTLGDYLTRRVDEQ